MEQAAGRGRFSAIAGEWSMRKVFLVGFFVLSGMAQADIVVVNPDNDRVQSILNLDIDGVLYNVYFDKASGGNAFIDDEAGAISAIDAINTVLNDGNYRNLDNQHPTQIPIYYVVTGTDDTYHAACRTGYIETCELQWVYIGPGEGPFTHPNPVAYFDSVESVAIDVDPASEINVIYVNTASRIRVGVLTADGFDAQQVNLGTLKLGPGQAPYILTPEITDVGGDPSPDLLVKFDTRDTDVLCGDTDVTLTGESYTNGAFTGTDTITTDCVDTQCHP